MASYFAVNLKDMLFFLVSEMLNVLIDISNNECSQYYCKVITLGSIGVIWV